MSAKLLMPIVPPKPALVAEKTSIPGLLQLRPHVVTDARGQFAKVFHEPLWRDLGLATSFAEDYWSRSAKGVIRGFHFQNPPMQHVKVVTCVEGEVLDVVLDLRKGSPTYQKVFSTTMSAAAGTVLYIPEGLGHAFCTLSEGAVLYYKVTKPYSPEHDTGVLWNSVDFDWPVQTPVLSERDRSFLPLDKFDSPFRFQ